MFSLYLFAIYFFLQQCVYPLKILMITRMILILLLIMLQQLLGVIFFIKQFKLSNYIKDIQVVYLFKEIQCWKGMHVFHAICGILCGILLITFGIFFSIFYFDGIYDSSKSNSKKNNHPILGMTIYQVFLVFTYNFIGD